MTSRLLTALVLSLCAATSACKKDSSDDSATDSTGSVNGAVAPGKIAVGNVDLQLDASGVDSAEAATLRLNDNGGFSLTPVDPYPGIGINSGEAVVDGLKIWLTKVSMENQVDSDARNTNNRTVQIFDWSASPKELQIAKGYTGSFSETIKTYVKPGEYNRLAVSMLDKLSMKAYAYLDTDNDGTIDTTIFTTATEIKKVAEILDPLAMPATYDYYTYGYIGVLTADSLVASTKTAGTLTVFDKPVIIPETDVDAKAAAGETVAIADNAPPVSLNLALVVDTTYLLKVWDGRFGDTATTPNVRGTSHTPQPQFPFPMDADPTHGRRSDPGLTQLDFYPEGKPAFGLGNYIPMFAFANVGKASFQVYAFSLDQNYDSFWAPNDAGSYRKTLIVTVALDKDGVPLLSRTTSLAEGQELFIGAIGRLFEKGTDSKYTFYTDYGVTDANGKDDGGLFYHSDKTMAGHIFSGFDASAAVGSEFQVMQKDGPRCSAQYDYCVGAAGKSLWVKRLK